MRRTLALAVLGTTLLTPVALTPAAHAAPITGFTTLTLGGKAASSLKQQKVVVTATAPAEKGVGTRYVLPLTAATFGSSKTLVEQGGSLVFTRKAGGKMRRTTLRSLRVELGKNPAVTGKFGSRRITVLTLDLLRKEYTASASGLIVKVEATRAALTPAAREVLRAKLKTTKLKSGDFAVLTTSGRPPLGTATSPGTAANPGTGGAATTPGTGGPTAGAASCSDASVALARPATATDVTATSLRWHVRESFIQYLAGGGNSYATPGGGATAEPAVVIDGQPPLVYDFNLVPAGGWHDAASGKTRLLFTGAVNFSYPSHGLAFGVSNLEVETNGADSRVIASFVAASATGFKGRTLLACLPADGLRNAGAAPAHSFSQAPGTVPGGTADTVFGGFYSAGDQFGWFSFGFTGA